MHAYVHVYRRTMHSEVDRAPSERDVEYARVVCVLNADSRDL